MSSADFDPRSAWSRVRIKALPLARARIRGARAIPGLSRTATIFWNPNKLERHIRFLDSHPAWTSVSWSRTVDEFGRDTADVAIMERVHPCSHCWRTT